jgi:hypothetical protein
MKKHRDADELAARIAAAANQPPVVLTTPSVTSATPEFMTEPKDDKQAKRRQKPKETEPPDSDTVPISLRPGRDLLNRYIIAASERTRSVGRVISAQQMMLEVLERGI